MTSGVMPPLCTTWVIESCRSCTEAPAAGAMPKACSSADTPAPTSGPPSIVAIVGASVPSADLRSNAMRFLLLEHLRRHRQNRRPTDRAKSYGSFALLRRLHALHATTRLLTACIPPLESGW